MRKSCKVKTRDGINLRGERMFVVVDRRFRRVTVITHIGNDMWLVDGRGLPKCCERDTGRRRLVVHRDELWWQPQQWGIA